MQTGTIGGDLLPKKVIFITGMPFFSTFTP